jgi:hypothetical protein
MGDPLAVDNTYSHFFADISSTVRGNRGISTMTSHRSISDLEIIHVLYYSAFKGARMLSVMTCLIFASCTAVPTLLFISA